MIVLVMAKEPIPGAVKTRLCPPCTPDQAVLVAHAALFDTFRALQQSDITETFVALHGNAGDWIPPEFHVFPQRGSTFAQRLHNAWTHVSEQVNGECVAQIGMDTPQITPDYFVKTEELLTNDERAVLGTTVDGGWYLLGLRNYHEDMFDAVPMSTADTGNFQRKVLERAGYTVRDLPQLIDVDYWSDARDVSAGMDAQSALFEKYRPSTHRWEFHDVVASGFRFHRST